MVFLLELVIMVSTIVLMIVLLRVANVMPLGVIWSQIYPRPPSDAFETDARYAGEIDRRFGDREVELGANKLLGGPG